MLSIGLVIYSFLYSFVPQVGLVTIRNFTGRDGNFATFLIKAGGQYQLVARASYL